MQIGASYIEKYLNEEHKVRLICMLVEGELYLRISASVYTDDSDFDTLNHAVLKMMELDQVPQHNPGYDIPIVHWNLQPLLMEYPDI